MPLRCCETCLSFGDRTVPDGVPICHACASWTTKAMCDDALRATNALTRCTLYRPAPFLINAAPSCARCAHYQPQDRMRPCAAGRAFHVPQTFTDAPDALNSCALFDIDPSHRETSP